MSVVAATAARLLRLPVAALIGTQAFRGVRDHPGPHQPAAVRDRVKRHQGSLDLLYQPVLLSLKPV
jgi:hypothetical protein